MIEKPSFDSGRSPEVYVEPEVDVPRYRLGQTAADEYWKTQFVDLVEEDVRPNEAILDGIESMIRDSSSEREEK